MAKRRCAIGIEKLYEYVTYAPNGCHEYTRLFNIGGYGIAWVDGRNIVAHRLSWMLQRGQIPAGMLVCHKCDNRRCINVEHLFLGSQTDNKRDAMAKGRHARGDKVGTSKLTEEDVRAIKSSTDSSRTLVMRFGISKQHVNEIRRGKWWGWVQVETPKLKRNSQ